MSDISHTLKSLKLYGMAQCWSEMTLEGLGAWGFPPSVKPSSGNSWPQRSVIAPLGRCIIR